MSPTKKVSKKSAKSTTAKFTDEEREAMRARVRELKAGKGDGERDVLAAIAAMGTDRGIGERLHALIKASAPALSPKTWYGMPAYAGKDGKVVCFFRAAQKFKERYITLGFQDTAKLDDGNLWPIAYALTKSFGTLANDKPRPRMLERGDRFRRGISGHERTRWAVEGAKG